MLSTSPSDSGVGELLSTHKDGLEQETLRNLKDLSYSAGFDVGTPAKRVHLIFDTGSADLWVSDTVWKPTQHSSTWHNESAQLGDKAEIFLQYGQGDIKGKLGMDAACRRHRRISASRTRLSFGRRI